MIATESLEDICLALESFKVDFERLVSMYKSHPDYNPENEFIFSEYERAFKDNFTRDCLDKVKKMRNYFEVKDFYVNTDKYYIIKDDLERFHIVGKFRNKQGKLRKGSHLITCEKLVKVDRIPAIIQTCVGNFMKKQRFNNEIKVLRRIFGDRFGYVVFSPEEYFVAPLAARIIDNGGHLARFPITKLEFRDALKEVLDSHGLKIRAESANSAEKRVEARLEAAS